MAITCTPTECPECESTDLRWDMAAGMDTMSPFPNSTVVTFFLGCQACSETVATMSADDVVAVLNSGSTDV